MDMDSWLRNKRVRILIRRRNNGPNTGKFSNTEYLPNLALIKKWADFLFYFPGLITIDCELEKEKGNFGF